MIIAILICLAVVLFVCWRLSKTNIDVPPDVEEKVSARQALQFAIDNDLPIK